MNQKLLDLLARAKYELHEQLAWGSELDISSMEDSIYRAYREDRDNALACCVTIAEVLDAKHD